MSMVDKKIAKRFALLLKKRRQQRRLTQDKLSELSGVSVEHIRRLEGNTPCGIRLQAIVKLADALEMTASTFLKDL